MKSFETNEISFDDDGSSGRFFHLFFRLLDCVRRFVFEL